MRIVVGRSDLRPLKGFERLVDLLASNRGRGELFRGVVDAGRKTKTPVQKAVFRQMGLKPGTYNSVVVAGTRGIPRRELLAYDIYGVKGGQKIQLYKGLKVQKIFVPQSGAHRYSKVRAQINPGTIGSAIWNVPRVFQRSYSSGSNLFAIRANDGGGPGKAPRTLWSHDERKWQPRDMATGRFLPDPKNRLNWAASRILYGPSLMKEIPEDQSLITFLTVGPANLEVAVMKRVTKLMRF